LQEAEEIVGNRGGQGAGRRSKSQRIVVRINQNVKIYIWYHSNGLARGTKCGGDGNNDWNTFISILVYDGRAFGGLEVR